MTTDLFKSGKFRRQQPALLPVESKGNYCFSLGLGTSTVS